MPASGKSRISRLASAISFSRMTSSARSGVISYGSSVLSATYLAADIGRDFIARRGAAKLARQLEKLHRLRMGDLVHLLTGPEAGKPRLVVIVLGADLHERPESAHAHAHRLAAHGIHP